MERKGNSVPAWILGITMLLALAMTPSLIGKNFDSHDWRGFGLGMFILLCIGCSWRWLSHKR